jgi:ABC-2 type transport system permease protein
MAANARLQPINEPSWRAGLASLVRKELQEWWGTPTWWRQVFIWLVLLNGLWALVLFTTPPEVQNGPGVEVFTILSGIFAPLGVIIFLGGAIVNEKLTGTVAWILSKPVSRGSFVLSKLAAHSLNFLITIIVVPGIVGYLEASAAGLNLPLLPFVVGLGLLYLNLLFYLSLTLMLGTFFRSPTPVIAIPVLLLFLQVGLTQATGLGIYLPGAIPFIGPTVMAGEPLPSLFPLGAAAGFTPLFSALAIWRFGRDEF